MKKTFVGALVATGLAMTIASTANAALVVTPLETHTIALQPTSFFDAPMTFSKFDVSLGTLQQVLVTLQGNVQGTARYESQDASPATITLDLQAFISLTRPGGGNIAQALPVAHIVDGASLYDGNPDFAGTSGATFAGLSASASDSQVLSSVGDLALFSASFFGETINLELDAIGASTGSGAGNLLLSFVTNGGATASIQYVYDNGITIPEPGPLAALGLGIAALAFARRRKA